MNAQLDMTGRPINPHGPTLDSMRAEAQKNADEHKIVMVVGWQVNDTTGEKEYGFCPEHAAGNAFVVEVLETIRPYKGGRADFAARQERRKDRLTNAAANARAESSQRYQNSRAAVAHIPFGQPIMVGHHSERGHRSAIEKAHNNMRKSVEADARANTLESRAESVGTGGISSDDPAALVKLRAEVAGLERHQDLMKKANAGIRKYAKNGIEKQTAVLIAIGFSDTEAAALLKPDFASRIGFPDYRLKNNNANIRAKRARIESLQRVSSEAEGERKRSKSGVIFNVEDNRVQLLFSGKPSDAIRTRLKSNGFRWSPTSSAWQRNLNSAGLYVASEFIDWLDSNNL